MKKYFSKATRYFNNKKYFILGISALLIGIIIMGSNIAAHYKKNKENTFKTISYDEEATQSGQIAGAFDENPSSTPSPTLVTYNQTYIRPSQIITPTRVMPTSASSASTNTTNPTATPVPANNNTVQNTATPAPTSPPSAPTATPKPSFSASINTNVDGDTLHVTVEANSPLKVCVIHYLKEVSGAFVPVDTKNVTPDGNRCNTDSNKSDIKKVKAYIASTEGATAEVEKSGPFE